MLRKNKGFTLVELLIVIVVIGILSAMMMLSSTEAVNSARVATIIADLNNLKKALMVWHTDNYDRIEHDPSKKEAGMIFNDKQNRYQPIQETEIVDEIVERYLSGAKINIGGKAANKEMSEGSYGVYDGGEGNNAKNQWSGLPKGVQTGRLAWFVGYRFTKSEYQSLHKKLKGREKSLGLKFGGKYPNANWGQDNCYSVWMRVL